MNKHPTNPKIDEAYASYVKNHFDTGIKLDIKTLGAVLIGSLMFSVNIKVFLNNGGLLSAGLSGIVLLAQRICLKYFALEIPFWPLSLLLNLFPAYLAYKHVGKKFTAFSAVSILVVSFATDLIPGFVLTEDKLLIAIFGGIINGAAASLILKSGASSGGTDFIAMYYSVKKGINTYNYVFAANCVVILISGILFGMDCALYTIIYQFVSTQMLNLIYTRYTRRTLMIVTDKPQKVCDIIMSTTHHACTVLHGEGAYTGDSRNVVYTVIGADELHETIRAIRKTDGEAFINAFKSDTVRSNFYQRPIL